MKNHLILAFIFASLTFSSCSKYQKLLKSTDNDLKYETAMDLFEKKDYNRALELFDLLQAVYRGTSRGEEIGFNMAYCYYYQKDYTLAAYYFKRHAQTYPNTPRAEEALFMNAYCYYLDSPRPSLDQANTHLAIKELQEFINTYPRSERVARSNELIDNLRDKLELKDFNIAMLYYRMRDYQAAITTFQNILKNTPTPIGLRRYTPPWCSLTSNMPSEASHRVSRNGMPLLLRHTTICVFKTPKVRSLNRSKAYTTVPEIKL